MFLRSRCTEQVYTYLQRHANDADGFNAPSVALADQKEFASRSLLFVLIERYVIKTREHCRLDEPYSKFSKDLAMDPRLVGTWESTEAFGNTALDWSQDVKDGVATLRLSFAADGHVGFQVDGPKNYAHVLPPESTCECNTGDKRLTMHGDKTGLAWFYQVEDDMTLRLRLVGAKRFARCNGVDNIYFKRTTATDS